MSRSRLILRLTQLKAQWQGTQQRVQQHGKCLEGLMGHWQLYEAGSRKLSRLLRHIEELLLPAGLALCSLQQLQCSIKDFEVSDKTLFFQLHTLNASSDADSFCISYTVYLTCSVSLSGLRNNYSFMKNCTARLWRQADRSFP